MLTYKEIALRKQVVVSAYNNGEITQELYRELIKDINEYEKKFLKSITNTNNDKNDTNLMAMV